MAIEKLPSGTRGARTPPKALMKVLMPIMQWIHRRTGNRMRKANLRETLDYRPRLREGLHQQREGRRFAAEATFGDMWRETRFTWEGLKREARWDRKQFGDSVRYGHLDSGE